MYKYNPKPLNYVQNHLVKNGERNVILTINISLIFLKIGKVNINLCSGFLKGRL